MLHFRCDIARSPDDLATTAVTDHQIEAHLLATRRPLLDVVHGLARAARQTLAITEYAHFNSLADQLIAFLADVMLEQLHERGNFRRGAMPVFLGKSVEREVFDADLGGRFDDGVNRLHARRMPAKTRQPARFCLTPIAIHDDRNVRRHDTAQWARGPFVAGH